MRTLPFSQLVDVNPSVKLAKGADYPFVEMRDVEPGRRWVRSSQTRGFESGGSRFSAGDTLFARITPCLENGKIAQYKGGHERPLGFGSTEFIVFRAKPGVADPGFVCYLARSDIVRGPAEKSMSGTSGRQRADIASFVDVSVPAPSLSTQRKITAILSAYDDLIENSLRRIEILEEMARRLYREWFVEFRFPGHERARFVDSPLGRIPEGWRIERLGDVATIRTGRSNRQDAVPDGAYPFFDRSSETKRSDRFLFDCEAVIVPGEGRRFRPRYWRAGPFDLHQRVYGLTDFKGVDGTLVYFALLDRHEYFARAATGATVKPLRKGTFERFEFVAPTRELMDDFACQVRQDLHVVDFLVERNAALREARDLLLPRLVSGDLDVSDLPVRPRPLYVGDPLRLKGYRFFRDMAALPFVEKIVLFGSRARGDHESRSDIDLCVFCNGASEDEWLEVLACLEPDRVDTLLKVDCVRFETSNAALRENVLTEGIVLFERGEGP